MTIYMEVEYSDGVTAGFNVADTDAAMEWVIEQDKYDPPLSVWLDGEPWLGLCTRMDYGIP